MLVYDGAPKGSRQALPGEMMELNASTPAGLFEAGNGDRFIVSDDGDAMIAIVLRHHNLPTYTWITLGDSPAPMGRWWGPYTIELAELLEFKDLYMLPGTISRAAGTAAIKCLRGDEQRSLMPLGAVRRNLPAAEIERWRIKPRFADFVFCGQHSAGSCYYEDSR